MKDVQIVAPAGEWERIREDPRFIELLRLGRAANSLALAWGPLLRPLSDQTPRARRDRFAALFYAAAILKEGLHTAQSLGKWYREVPQYKQGFAAIFNDPAVRSLQSSALNKARDELVFHFERDALAIGASRLPDVGIVVVSYPDELGPQFGETYFDVADDAVLGYLFGDATTDTEYLERLEAFMTGVSDLVVRFMSAAHRLIAVGLIELGCEKRRGQRPVEPD